MIVAVVLNYNNYKQSIHCCTRLLESGVDRVVLVDNNSTNQSYAALNQFFERDVNVSVIRTFENRGYAAGNNTGIHYVENNFKPLSNIILMIVNPDVVVNRATVNKLVSKVKSGNNVGGVTALINGEVNSAWHHITPFTGFVFNSWITLWILTKFKLRQGGYYKVNQEKNDVAVDVVTGALFAIKLDVMLKVGCFDEGTFLYFEEEALSSRLRDAGFISYLVTDCSFTHEGRGSTSLNKIAFKRINDASRLYVLQKYYGTGAIYTGLYKLINHVDNLLLRILRR